MSKELIDAGLRLQDVLLHLQRLADLLPPPKPEVGVPRSSRWPKTRERHLERFPACQACGGTKELQVHHCLPFHANPELELEESNLITLCEYPSHNCHFIVGHCMNWRKYNPSVRGHARLFRSMIEGAKT